MNSLINLTPHKWKSLLVLTALLITITIPSQGQNMPNTNRSVYIEGMQTFTIMANTNIGHTTNSVINVNSIYTLESHNEGVDTYTTVWRDGINRVIEHKAVGMPSIVVIQAKKANGTYGSILRNRNTTNNTTIATAFKNPNNWVWAEGVTVLGGNSSVNLTNMFMTQATLKERAAAKELSESLNFTNGRWRPQ